MLKTQAVADLAVLVSQVAGTDRAQESIRRALRLTGLTNAVELRQSDLHQLLAALSTEGGRIEELAMEIALSGLGPTLERRMRQERQVA